MLELDPLLMDALGQLQGFSSSPSVLHTHTHTHTHARAQAQEELFSSVAGVLSEVRKSSEHIAKRNQLVKWNRSQISE